MLFDFELLDATKLFNQVVIELGYDQHRITFSYQIRHGSATDVLSGHRTLTEVQKRGRLEAAKSAKRYSNGGRMSQPD